MSHDLSQTESLGALAFHLSVATEVDTKGSDEAVPSNMAPWPTTLPLPKLG